MPPEENHSRGVSNELTSHWIHRPSREGSMSRSKVHFARTHVLDYRTARGDPCASVFLTTMRTRKVWFAATHCGVRRGVNELVKI